MDEKEKSVENVQQAHPAAYTGLADKLKKGRIPCTWKTPCRSLQDASISKGSISIFRMALFGSALKQHS
ncbi:MAG: hypothetical protein ACLFUL_01300 [Desulfobacteraceae bacterium]